MSVAADVKDDQLKMLLIACKSGDRSAFQKLYDVQAPRLLAIALRMLGRREIAEDVLQDSFLTIWRKASQYQPELGSAAGWMTMIVRHRCIDWLRSDKSRTRLFDAKQQEIMVEEQMEQAGPFHEAWLAMDGVRLRACLEHLGPEPRTALLHAFYEGLTHEELSRKLAAPLGTIKSWVRRSLAQLRKCLEA